MEKIVETAEETGKLMFHITLQADPEVVKKYYRRAKTGMLGFDLIPGHDRHIVGINGKSRD
jgi:hypothetical protein